jgi:hypothetical protein
MGGNSRSKQGLKGGDGRRLPTHSISAVRNMNRLINPKNFGQFPRLPWLSQGYPPIFLENHSLRI